MKSILVVDDSKLIHRMLDVLLKSYSLANVERLIGEVAMHREAR